MKKLFLWLHDNIDHFYDNEKLRNKFLGKYKLDKHDFEGLMRLNQVKYQKQRLIYMLMNWAENKIIKRRNRLREKNVE